MWICLRMIATEAQQWELNISSDNVWTNADPDLGAKWRY